MNKKRRSGLGLLALVGLVVVGLWNTTIVHSAGVIYVKADAIGANDGTSWEDAFLDLQDALAASQGGDEIWVAAGTYKPTDSADRYATFDILPGGGGCGLFLYGGFVGTESDRSQRDWGSSATGFLLVGVACKEGMTLPCKGKASTRCSR